MSVVLMLSISLAVAAGVLLILSRDVVRLIVGLAVLGSTANLVVFMAGRPPSLIPPIIEVGAGRLPADAANPLPQALVLTAIVISFALLCFALVLGAYLSRRSGHENVDHMRSAEPPATDPLKPPEMDA
ncbi:MAG: NADH-quinone oxidoreductase subunit K [Gammaproteobacteria bacterium]